MPFIAANTGRILPTPKGMAPGKAISIEAIVGETDKKQINPVKFCYSEPDYREMS